MTPEEQIKALTAEKAKLEAENALLRQQVDAFNPPEATDEDRAVLKLIAADADGMQHWELLNATKWTMAKIVHTLERLLRFHFIEFHDGGHKPTLFKLSTLGAAHLSQRGEL